MENNVMTMFAILNLLVYTILCTHVWCQLTLCEELGCLQMLFTTKIASIMFVTTRCDLDDKGSHRSTFWSSHCLPTTFQTVWVIGTSRTHISPCCTRVISQLLIQQAINLSSPSTGITSPYPRGQVTVITVPHNT